jgi:hypothetical protein
MKSVKALLVLAAAFTLIFTFAASQASAQNNFYMEVAKNGRIYVFANQDAYTAFAATGETETGLTRIGAGPNGETIFFDSDEALHMYNFKHNLPDEVIPKPPTPPPPPVQEKLPYRFSGLMYFDYFYNVQRDPNLPLFTNIATQPGPEDFNGFQFRRIYFTFDDDLSEHFTTRFRLEADQVALTSDLKVSVFVKDAWLRWKDAFDHTDMIFGFQPTAAYDASEVVWNYRSLEKTIMDLRGIVPSRDLSFSIKGKFDDGGKYNWWVMIGDNSGNRPELDKFKRFYFNFLWRPTEKIYVNINDDIKQNAEIPDPNNPAKTLGANVNTFDFFVGYTTKDKYAVGVEAFFQNNANGNKTQVIGSPIFNLKNRTADGVSVWGWWNFSPRFGVVGRYDFFEPNKLNTIKGDTRGLYLASAVIKPFKNFWIMPNVEIESYEKTITGQTFKDSITPRVTLNWFWP